MLKRQFKKQGEGNKRTEKECNEIVLIFFVSAVNGERIVSKAGAFYIKILR